MPTDALGSSVPRHLPTHAPTETGTIRPSAAPLHPRLLSVVIPATTAVWGLAAILCTPGVLLRGSHAQGPLRLADALLPMAAAAVALPVVLLASRSVPADRRRPWHWAAVGCLAWIVGQLGWASATVWSPGEGPDWPGPAWAPDLGSLFAAAAMTVVVATSRADAGRSGRWAHEALDGVVLALGTLSICLAFGGDTSEVIPSAVIAPSCLLAQLVMVTLAALSSRPRNPLRLPLGMVSTTVAVFALAEVSLTHLRGLDHGDLMLGLLQGGGFVLLAVVAAHQLRDSGQTADVPHATRVVLPTLGSLTQAGHRAQPETPLDPLPYLLLAVSLSAVAVQWVRTGSLAPASIALVLAAAVLTLARQYLTLRDNLALTRQVAEGRDEVYRQALNDPLTGQASRATFTRRLRRALAGQQAGQHPGHQGQGGEGRRERSVAVMVCDIDGFKSVNDGLGHVIGDRLLALVAWRLRACLPHDATLARLGGDEFAVLLHDLEPTTADTAARGMAHELRTAVAEPFSMDGVEVCLGLSIGVVVVPSGPEAPAVDAVLSRADIALHTAKRAHLRAPMVYSEGLSLPEGRDWQLRPAIEQALREGAIEAHYQPVVELCSGKVRAVEALARWNRDGEQVPPEVFLPVITRAGILPELTRHMVRRAAVQVAAWEREGIRGGLRVAVNVSPSQLTDPGFADLVRSALDFAQLPPCGLILEITEESLLDDLDAAVSVVGTLRDIGVQVWLDDFGTGYSSLSLLHRLPLHAVKLDKGLVRTVDLDPALHRLVGGLVSLAGDLGLDVIAEGIQRQEQARVLRELGCPLGQGFLFAPPLGARAAANLLAAGMAAPGTWQSSWRVPAARTSPPS